MKTNSIIFNCKILVVSKKYTNIKFIYYKNKECSLLKMLQRHHISVNYQCQLGYCGSCRAFLIQGKIQYYQEPLGSISMNEVLLCCCYPIEDIILKL